MRTKNITHAFVTSTLPVSYFLNRKFDFPIIIHCTKEVFLSFQAAQISNENLVIKEIPSSLFHEIKYILRTIMYASDILVFHECCWPILDILLILSRSNVSHKPIVTLNGYRFLKNDETSFIAWFKFFSNHNFINRLLKSISSSFFSIFFHHAECTDDGGNTSLRIPVLKEKFKRGWIASSPYHSSNQNLKLIHNQSNEIKSPINNVLILCATEPIDNLTQIQIYNKIIDLFVRNNFSISYKDHPRMNARLGLKNSLATEINPLLPSQLFNQKYDIVIGAFSTSLIEVRGIKRTISIGKLINLPESVYFERIRHLEPFIGFKNIDFIDDLNELLAHHQNL